MKNKKLAGYLEVHNHEGVVLVGDIAKGRDNEE